MDEEILEVEETPLINQELAGDYGELDDFSVCSEEKTKGVNNICKLEQVRTEQLRVQNDYDLALGDQKIRERELDIREAELKETKKNRWTTALVGFGTAAITFVGSILAAKVYVQASTDQQKRYLKAEIDGALVRDPSRPEGLLDKAARTITK